jgi:hypothetical protein
MSLFLLITCVDLFTFQDIVLCGFSTSFSGKKFNDLTEEIPVGQTSGLQMARSFKQYLSKVIKHPYLYCYCQPNIDENVVNEKDYRINLVIDRLISVLWANGVSFPSKGRQRANEKAPLMVSGVSLM